MFDHLGNIIGHAVQTVKTPLAAATLGAGIAGLNLNPARWWAEFRRTAAVLGQLRQTAKVGAFSGHQRL